jgi:hypothetical protein
MEGRRKAAGQLFSFGSPRTEEGAASGGAWHGNAGRAGGGGSGVRKKETTPEVGQVGRNARPQAKTGRKT